MNEKIQKELFNFLQKHGVKNFIGIPDSTMKHFIKEGLRKKKILIPTREEEAIGIAVGMVLSGSSSLVFMQNAGFANCISSITSLIQLYKIPIIFLIGWRGYLINDAPEHKKIGKIQPDLIKAIGLKSKILDDKNWKSCSLWALKAIRKGIPCGLIIKREFID